MKHDIVLIQAPFTFNVPQAGISYLKSNIEKHGYTCKIIDWNFKIFKLLKTHYDEHYNTSDDVGDRMNMIWLFKIIPKYLNKGIFSNTLKQLILENISMWLDELKQLNPKYIGFSIFNHKYLIQYFNLINEPIKNKFPDTKFVIGGTGLFLDDSIQQDIEKLNLFDYFIYGDGEDSVIELLNDNYQTKKIYNQTKNLEEYPYPDYSDYVDHLNMNWIPINISRGCVNNCTFCFKKYKGYTYKNPDHVIKELKYLNEKYEPVVFAFDDYLINGHKPKFIKLLDNIIEYNKTTNHQVKWHAHFSCFKKNEEDILLYKKLGDSNCFAVTTGIESGSNKILNDMRKNINIDDIKFMFEHLDKNNINHRLNIMVGYFTETREDFDKTIDLITWLKNNINLNTLTFGMSIFELTLTNPVWFQYGIKRDGYGSWYYKDNTFISRCKRWLELYLHSKSVGLRVVILNHHEVMNNIYKYQKDFEIDDLIQTFENIFEGEKYGYL